MRGSFIHNRLKLLYEMHKLLWLGINKKACCRPLYSRIMCVTDARKDLQQRVERANLSDNVQNTRPILVPGSRLYHRAENSLCGAGRAPDTEARASRWICHFVPDEKIYHPV